MTQQWHVETEKQAHAFLGNNEVNHTFRLNPDTVEWDYAENIVPYDTIGGRVLQVLSGKTNGMTINGRAGSRGELQRLANNCKNIMQYHIKTQEPVYFKVPSKSWNFIVYLQAVPQIGWSVGATSYPYQIVLSVVDDLKGITSQEMRAYTLERLATGIGYNPNVHGGDAMAFSDLVNSLQLSFETNSADEEGDADADGGGSGGGSDVRIPVPSNFIYANETRSAGTIDFSRRTGNTPDWVRQRPNLFTWNGTTLQEDAMKSFQVLCQKVGKITTSTSYRTFEQQTRLYNLYISGNGNKAAKPGTSYHEIGLAIDMYKEWYERNTVIMTFKNNDWFKVVDGEPWHFSFRVAG